MPSIIVKQFLRDNPNEINKVQSLTATLTQELAKPDLSSAHFENREVLFIPGEAFPKEMRAWVAAHGRLNLEKIKEIDKEVEVKEFRAKQPAKAVETQLRPKEVEVKEAGAEQPARAIEAQLKPKEVEVKEAGAEQPARAREVQLKPSYTYASQEWGDIDIVLKAKAGVNGAWFYTNSQRGSVVVKAGEDLEIQLMGTTFLKLMGISVPDLRIVDRYSKEGQQISELGEDEGLNARNPKHYVVMDRVLGSSYCDLPPTEENIKMIVNNLENMGELAMYDLVLGNFDRFQLSEEGLNPGNIMFQDKVLYAIDTDCVRPERQEGFTKLAFKKIVEKRANYHEKMARQLAKNLGSKVDPSTFSSEKILIGMERALDRLAKLADNMEALEKLFVQSCSERGGKAKALPDHVIASLQHIKSIKSSKK